MATKPIKFLELHYTMTQFLIISDISQSQLGNIQSCDVFRPIVLKQKYLMDYNAKYVLMFYVDQSLNYPFFPLHTGVEPGRAKRESRITCMRMLRTNQSKITMLLASMCRAIHRDYFMESACVRDFHTSW